MYVTAIFKAFRLIIAYVAYIIELIVFEENNLN